MEFKQDQIECEYEQIEFEQDQGECEYDEMQEEDKIHQLNDNLEQKIHDQLYKEPEIQLVSLYNQVELKKNNDQKILAMISIKSEDAKQTKQIPEVGVDLICLIDKSRSMEGLKMKTVKQCLNQLLEFLSEKDRLCLIVFDSSSYRLCSFKSCSLQNKIKIRQIIQKIYANGCTDIGSSTKLALQQILERKFKNKVTSIFLLSDGEDNQAYESVKNQLEQIDDPFTIHSFGFGSDHDAQMMSDICSLRNGAFYFVNEIQLLDEYFVNALGSLVGVFYDKINIRIEVLPNDTIQNISIYKTYGHMWMPIENNQIYNITLQQIAQGQRRDYLFKIKLQQLAEISNAQRQQIIIKAIVKMRNINSNQIIEKQVNLQLQFYNENEKHHMLEQKNNDVEKQYYRVKAANMISNANQLCQEEQYKEGQCRLEKLIDKIKMNHFADQLKEIIEDLQQAVEATKYYPYSNIGSKLMIQICSNNLNQAGQNSRFDRNLIQQSQPIRGMFDTQAQDLMRVSLMFKKSIN